MKFDLTNYDQKRSEILNATYQTIYEQGIVEMSMRSIARNARVNQSTLHYYFQSKENLLIEFINALFDRFLFEIERRFVQSDPPERKLEAIFEAGKDFAGKQRELFIVFIDCWALSVRHPEMKKTFSYHYVKMTRLFEGIIEEGIQADVFNGVRKDIISVMLIAFVGGMGMQWHMRKHSFDVRKHFSVLTENLRGIIIKERVTAPLKPNFIASGNQRPS